MVTLSVVKDSYFSFQIHKIGNLTFFNISGNQQDNIVLLRTEGEKNERQTGKWVKNRKF